MRNTPKASFVAGPIFSKTKQNKKNYCPKKSKSLCIQVSPRSTDQQSVKHNHVTESVIYGSAKIQCQLIVLGDLEMALHCGVH